jgi:hypothetical protein
VQCWCWYVGDWSDDASKDVHTCKLQQLMYASGIGGTVTGVYVGTTWLLYGVQQRHEADVSMCGSLCKAYLR